MALVAEEVVLALPEVLVVLAAVPGVPEHKLRNKVCTIWQL
jgi:hypothetical protein